MLNAVNSQAAFAFTVKTFAQRVEAGTVGCAVEFPVLKRYLLALLMATGMRYGYKLAMVQPSHHYAIKDDITTNSGQRGVGRVEKVYLEIDRASGRNLLPLARNQNGHKRGS